MFSVLYDNEIDQALLLRIATLYLHTCENAGKAY
jgi:hypothetical protein